jgi:hypothetical protein
MLLERVIRFFSSLKLTVVLLALGLILVFWGTMAQVEIGLYKAQNDFFRSVFIYWSPKGGGLKIPVFPGGYLLGTTLVLNLVAAHFRRFKFTKGKIGLFLIHVGLILLLLGQLLTDMLSQESVLHLRERQTKNYTEASDRVELAIVDTSDKESDKVIAIPDAVLRRQTEIRHDLMPFTLAVRKFMVNSSVADRPKNAAEPPLATQGFGPLVSVKEEPHVTVMEQRDMPTAIFEIKTAEGSLGTWLVSAYIDKVQSFRYKDRTYEMMLRRTRLYKPFSIQLVDFRHDVYPGTDIPKNFSSRVRLVHPSSGEDREVLIYMNNPLRYAGETYYQSSFDTDNAGTILQVVKNPSWLAPYAACVLVSAGLVIQFMSHMLGFVKKRRTA